MTPKERRLKRREYISVKEAYTALYEENQQLKAQLALYDNLMMRFARQLELARLRDNGD